MSELTKQAKYELAKGITLTVTPLSGFAQKMLHASAAQRHPEPDRAPFEVEIPDALIPGTKTKAEESAEWLRLMRDVLQKRQQAQIGLLLDTAVTVDDRDALVAPYQNAVDQFWLAMSDLPIGAALASDWVTLLLGVLAEEQEVSALIKLAQGATPLTDGEIVDGFRYFRSVVLSRPRRAIRHAAKESQDLQSAQPPADRPDDDGVRSGGDVQSDSRPDTDAGVGKLVRSSEGNAGGDGSVHTARPAGVGAVSE